MVRRRLNLKDASGATALEFALISPVLILMIIGFIQLAWVMHCAASVRWSLETSARNLMLNPTETADTLKSDMLSRLSGRADASHLSVSIASDASNPSAPLLVATSVFHTTLQIPFLDARQLTFTAVTKVPST